MLNWETFIEIAYYAKPEIRKCLRFPSPMCQFHNSDLLTLIAGYTSGTDDVTSVTTHIKEVEITMMLSLR